MVKLTISEAQVKTSPNPISLICTETPKGDINLAPISWWTYLANKPAMLGFAINPKSYTKELLERNQKTILCIPSEAISVECYQCGCVSGRNTKKAEKFNINLVEVKGTKIKIPEYSKIAFLCTVKNTVIAGDHTFFICNIDDILYNKCGKQLYAWDGYSRLAPLPETGGVVNGIK